MKSFPSSALLIVTLLFSLNLIGCSVPKTKSEIVKKKPDISITAVGDIMLGTNFPFDRLAPDDGANLLNAMIPFLKAADITFGNLEGVLLDGGEAAKKCKKRSSCYVFAHLPIMQNI